MSMSRAELDAHRKRLVQRAELEAEAMASRLACWPEFCASNMRKPRMDHWGMLCASNLGPADLYTEEPLPPLAAGFFPVAVDDVSLQWLRRVVDPQIRSFAIRSCDASGFVSETYRASLHYMDRESRLFIEHAQQRPLVLKWASPVRLRHTIAPTIRALRCRERWLHVGMS